MRPRTWWLLLLAALPCAGPAYGAEGRVGLYGIRMVPSGGDAESFSRPGWGAGIQSVVAMPGAAKMFAGVLGLEFVNLLSETIETYDPQTLLRIEQQTSQNYFRLYAGPEFGPHGFGTFRPHVGVNIAAVVYGISTDIVVPDDYDREREIRQNLRDQHEFAFGYDITAGLDINPWNTVTIDVGARFLKSFNVPQQLGPGSVTIHPGYVQTYLGIGVSLDWIEGIAEAGD
jgi:opacity protein-like surface antigen